MKHKQKRRKQSTYRLAATSLCAVLLFPTLMKGMQLQGLNASAGSAGINVNVTSELGITGGAANLIRFSSYEEKLQAAEDAKAELEAKKQSTEQKIAELEKEKADILSYIEKLDKELNAITLEIERLQAEIAKTKEELDQTKIDLAIAKETEENQYQTMKKRIQYMYENGSTNLAETLLSSESFVDFLNQVEYAKKISEYDNKLFKDYKETKELIANQEAFLTAQLNELNILEESAEFEQSTIEQLVADKSKEIDKYVAAIGISDELLFSYTEEITNQEMSIEEIREEEQRRIKEEEKRIKEEQERLAEEERKRKEEEKRREEEEKNNQGSDSSATVRPPTNETSSDKMIWPLPGDGRIFSYFGYRKAPTAGASTYHRGLDIGGETGASIVAVLAGTVEISTYSPTSGNYVIVNHGNGLRSAYLHCSKLLVSVGDYVKQGEVVGLVGSTGISTGPHLHFGVSINNVYVDPLDYISYN